MLGAVTRRLLIIVAAISLTACGASAAAPSRPSGSRTSTGTGSAGAGAGAAAAAACGPAGAKTIASSRGARVYESGTRVYGCAGRSGRSYVLGRHTSCVGGSEVGPVAVAGTSAAYGLATCGIDTGSAAVLVRELTDGKVVTREPATSAPLGAESYQHVDSVVLRSGGAVAWIGSASSIIRHTHEIEVHSADAHNTRLLDHGAGIAPMSLRLHGSRLSWRDGGGTRTAKLG
jgi:hypothetical protein